MAQADLEAIKIKVRRLTRSPSEAQITNAQLEQYINTFILYDMPNHIRLFSLRKTITFYTQPGVDQYSTVNLPTTDPLYDFKNRYIAVHPPVFLAGIQGAYTQNRSLFFGMWPKMDTIQDTTLHGVGS